MKRVSSLIWVALFLGLVYAGSALTEESSVDFAQETLIGEYSWDQGSSGDLKAVFSPVGKTGYNVAFYFDFREEPHTYTGTAEGSLDGQLGGQVKNEDGSRTYTFEGTFKDGVFEGTHFEVRSRGQRRTGTLSLQRAGA